MSEGERNTAAPDDGPAPARPSLGESIQDVGQAGRDALGASASALRALRALVSADLALARSALGRGLAWAGVAVVFGASAWLLATAAAVALMQRLGLSWLTSLSIAALFNLAVTGLAVWRTARFFDAMGLHATRRQLSRMGLFDEYDDDDDTPPAAAGAAPPATPAQAPPP